MSDTEHAGALVLPAEKDLKALRGMLDPSAFDVETFGFHAQQATERALKAWLSTLGVEYPRIHDLDELFALLERSAAIPEGLRGLGCLTDFAVQFRYEAYEGLGAELDRRAVLENVSNLLAHVTAVLREGPESCG